MIRTLRQPRKRATTRIGPGDNGRAMSLDQFDGAIGREGYLYELNQGVIQVTDVPQPKHFLQIQEMRRQLSRYQDSHPGVVHSIAGSHEAKLLVAPTESERHPDLCVYLSGPPDVPDVWSVWVPAIVVEVVSPSSIKRDYDEKPADYLSFGVDEYWIVDAAKKQMTVLSRWRGQWKKQVIRPTKKYATSFLPGFSLDLKKVLDVAK